VVTARWRGVEGKRHSGKKWTTRPGGTLVPQSIEPRASVCESHLPGQMTSRNAYTTSRFSVPASDGPLLPLKMILILPSQRLKAELTYLMDNNNRSLFFEKLILLKILN